jgi:hypothetical protein
VSLTYAYAGPITKSEKDSDGNLMVFGKATGPDLDLDEQVCDPKWLKTAMPDWARWSNVRAQHSAVAAGVGKELAADDKDGWWLKSLIVDADSIKKVENDVYKGYSIGIKNAKVVKDASAPGGRIVGGTVVEISLVDRPCNPTATMGIAKAHGAELAPVDSAGVMIAKFGTLDDAATVVADEAIEVVETTVVPDAAKSIESMPVVSDPVESAILTPRAYKSAVATVAKALAGEFGTAGVLVKAVGTNDETDDIAGAWAAIGVICDLVISEATELKTGRTEEIYDIKTLTDALCALTWFIDCEKMQDGSPAGPLTVSTDAVVAAVDMAVEAEVTKAAELQVDADGVETEPDYTAPVVESTPVVKSAPAEAVVPEVAPVVDIVKTKWTQAKRDAAEQAGHAMPGGKYPIEDASDVSDAVGLVGNGTDSKKKIRTHIMAQAKRVGAMDKIPDSWNPNSSGSSKSVQVDMAKTVDMSTNVDETVPTAAFDEDAAAEYVAKALTKAIAPLETELASVKGELAKVKAMPVPGGPFILPPPQPIAAITNKSEQAQRYRQIADQASDPGVASAYRAKAREVESNKD